MRQLSVMNEETQQRIASWLNGNYDDETKKTIRELQTTSPDKLNDAFYTTLTFGTGGMRGLMGVGTNRMNRYTVQSATQGLANYLKAQPIPQRELSVFISYDSRHQSREFAEESAKVLAANNIRVYLTKNIRPTPYVSFGCRFKHCSAAIMITASHNPPEYNGYKVYWNNGGQVLPPHDSGIIQEVAQITELHQIQSVDSLSHPLIEIVENEIDEAYLKALIPLQNYPEQNIHHGHQLNIAYTSLHGTGISLIPQALKQWGFTSVNYVKDQIVPDGNFPTVKYPNPEERAALSLGLQTMQATHSDILIATDPDADRVGIAVQHQGEIVLLNGNQTACLCLEHLCEALTKNQKMPEKAAFIKTIVTSELFRAICEAYQKKCFDVLTGFKYIAELITSWENPSQESYQFIFGGEESYGYLLGTHARDKDAIISSALIAEMALNAKREGKTLIDKLHDLYKKYGVYFENLISINFSETKEGREKMILCMEKLEKNPPESIFGKKVLKLENYKTSLQLDIETKKTCPILLPKSDVLIFWLEDKSKLMVRPSGTEPKIKIYGGVVSPAHENIALAISEAENHSKKLLEAFKSLIID